MALTVALSGFASATPAEDREAMRAYYQKRFPAVEVNAHQDGVYAFDQNAREQWLELEDFPPYEVAVDEGEELYNNPLEGIAAMGLAAIVNGQLQGDDFTAAFIEVGVAVFDRAIAKTVAITGAVGQRTVV